MQLSLSAAIVLTLLLPFAAAPAQAPAKRPMTFADLQAMKRMSDPQISPSGKWVLFSVTDVSLERNSKTNHLWVTLLDGSVKEVELTSSTGESNGRFSPDGKWVMYSSGEGGSGEIWVASWDDAKGRMGKGHAVTNLETEADGAIWAPDSRHFLFVSSVYPECESKASMGQERSREEAGCNARKDADAAKNPVKAEIFDHLLYRHWNSYVGPKHSHVFWGDAEAGTRDVPADLTPASVIGDHESPTFSLDAPTGYAIAPDGKEVAYVVNRDPVPAESTNNDIYVLQVGADPATARKVSTSPGSDDGPQYSPDGKWLAWRSQARNGFESDKFDLVVMDRATGAIKNLTATFDNWVDEFSWDPGSAGMDFTSARRGEERIYLVSLTGKAMLLAGNGEYGDLRLFRPAPPSTSLLDFRPWMVATRMSATAPSEIVAISLSDAVLQTPDDWETACKSIGQHQNTCSSTNKHVQQGAWDKALTHLNDAVLSQISESSQESFWFSGAGGAKVEGFLVRPPNFDPAKKYPVKFLMHGGPQGAWGDAWSYRWNPELFAANGYVVIMVNPRGSTGYGQKFLEEVSGDWGGRAFDDLMKGLDYAEQHYSFIDKNRECALGASYGGYMANWVLTHTNRFKCIVTHDGMYNPQSAFGDTEELWFNEWEFRPLAANGVVQQGKAAHPWDFYDKPAAEDPFRKWSPMLAIRNAHTPTLVVHSQRDYRLDVSEGMQLFTALQLLHVPSKMLYFPDEGHWVLKPRNSELWYTTVNDWCDRWLGMNKYADVGPEKNPAAVQGAAPRVKNAAKHASEQH